VYSLRSLRETSKTSQTPFSSKNTTCEHLNRPCECSDSNISNSTITFPTFDEPTRTFDENRQIREANTTQRRIERAYSRFTKHLNSLHPPSICGTQHHNITKLLPTHLHYHHRDPTSLQKAEGKPSISVESPLGPFLASFFTTRE
jgi:hypothetical protein